MKAVLLRMVWKHAERGSGQAPTDPRQMRVVNAGMAIRRGTVGQLCVGFGGSCPRSTSAPYFEGTVTSSDVYATAG